MPRGDWLKLSKAWRLALALAFAAAVAGASVGWGLWQQAEYERQAQHESAEHASYARDYIGNRCLALARLDKIDCATKARDEHRSYQRDEQDLVAQKTSALWTMIMGWAATFGMVLSAVGVYLVWTTFAETRRANQITLSEQRAWINIEVDEAKFTRQKAGDLCIVCKIMIVNIGRSPAHNLYYQTQHLKGQWQVAEQPDIYAPGGRGFYEAVIGDRRGIHVAALMPGEVTYVTAVNVVTDDTLSEPLGESRLLPRYAIYATYETVGLDHLGEIGKVVTFQSSTLIDHGKRVYGHSPVTAAIADRGTHVI